MNGHLPPSAMTFYNSDTPLPVRLRRENSTHLSPSKRAKKLPQRLQLTSPNFYSSAKSSGLSMLKLLRWHYAEMKCLIKAADVRVPVF
ncbi:hypothetical protein QQF64_011871 [Cirrhinus molitorella]|uniref:Uncharacterized protein n=1 Tax=Cirrhinus molitorella TaxID=172907 RepID=A0ABR3LTU4_9TELE